MKRVTHERSKLGDSLKATTERLNNLDRLNQPLRNAVVDDNSALNFDPSHPLSNLTVERGRVVLGSKSKPYARLLKLDGERLVEIVGAFIIHGRAP